MAQQPAKLAWKEKTPFGLSASQFGMALGYCGKVSDYVDYQRNIVGTEQEFTGNAATAHGTNTEPKARALYELLTGYQVYDGGFFLSDNRMLGCSPDGRSFYYGGEASAAVKGSHGHTWTGRDSDGGRCLDIAAKRSLSEADGQLYDLCESRVDVADPRPTVGSAGVTTPGGAEADGVPDALPHVRTCFSVKVPFCVKRPRAWTRGGDHLPRHSSSQPTPSSAGSPVSRLSDDEAAGTRSLMHVSGTGAAGSPTVRAAFPRRKTRLLEIKCPFRALYDCNKANYRPYGIPLQYMCQMQGQMAIADADECDFFVYLDSPQCEVEAWRVYRSHSFWQWAKPKLLQVVYWVRDGPPESLNRAFAFDAFDFGSLRVEPLVFPFSVSAQNALRDARRFAFFAQFTSPYAAPMAGVDSQDGTGSLIGPSGLRTLYSDAIQFLFDSNDRQDAADEAPATSASCDVADCAEGLSPTPPERPMMLFTVRGGLQESLYESVLYEAVLKGKWAGLSLPSTDDDAAEEQLTAEAFSRSRVQLRMPESWDAGEVEVRFAVPNSPTVRQKTFETVCRVRLYHRDFFNMLVAACPVAPNTVVEYATGAACAAADPEGLHACPHDLDGRMSQLQVCSPVSLLERTVMDSTRAEGGQSRTVGLQSPQKGLASSTVTGSPSAVGQQRVGRADLWTIFQEDKNCTRVVVVESLSSATRSFWRGDSPLEPPSSHDDTTYTLVLGEASTVAELSWRVQARRPPDSGTWHRSVVALVRQLSEERRRGYDASAPCCVGKQSRQLPLVFCCIHSTSESSSPHGATGDTSPFDGGNCYSTLCMSAESAEQLVQEIVQRLCHW